MSSFQSLLRSLQGDLNGGGSSETDTNNARLSHVVGGSSSLRLEVPKSSTSMSGGGGPNVINGPTNMNGTEPFISIPMLGLWIILGITIGIIVVWIMSQYLFRDKPQKGTSFQVPLPKPSWPQPYSSTTTTTTTTAPGASGAASSTMKPPQLSLTASEMEDEEIERPKSIPIQQTPQPPPTTSHQRSHAIARQQPYPIQDVMHIDGTDDPPTTD